MKSHLINLSIIPILLSLSSNAQFVFKKTISSPDGIAAFSIDNTPEGGFVIVGKKTNATSLDDAFICKLNYLGDSIWSETIGTTRADVFNLVSSLPDSSFIVSGYLYDTALSIFSGHLVGSFSTNGIRGPMYGYSNGAGEGRLTYYKNINTSSGGYIKCGYLTDTSMTTSLDAIISISDNQSGHSWTNALDINSNDDIAYSLLKTRDGGYFSTGQTSQLSGNNSTIFIIKTDFIGNIVWSYTLSGFLTMQGNSALQTSDGGYLIAGMKNQSNLSDIILIKIDSIGNVSWSKTFDILNHDYITSLHQTSDGGFIMLGNVASAPGINESALLLKIDSMGIYDWSKNYRYTGKVNTSSLIQTPDNGYVFTGYYTNSNVDTSFIVKTDSSGNSGCSDTIMYVASTASTLVAQLVSVFHYIGSHASSAVMDVIGHDISFSTDCPQNLSSDELENDQVIKLFPNPANEKLTIVINQNQDFKLEIYDGKGVSIMSISGINESELIIDLENFPNGIYYVNMRTPNQSWGRKLSVLH